jgi:hypothetical protein
MSFTDEYTTNELLLRKSSSNFVMNLEGVPEVLVDEDSDKEESKIILSNDAYAIGQLLETLINKLGRN